MTQPEQVDLFAPNTPVARNADPDTSHLAAIEVTLDGTRARQAREILGLVRRFPGRTAREYDHVGGFPREVAHRRLPELEDKKNGALIYRGEKRTCTQSGKLSITWYPMAWETMEAQE